MSTNTDRADADPESGKEQLKQAVWAYGLAAIPTTLGRLIYLASLRDEKTGRYDGSQLAELRGEADRDIILHEIHENVFGTWLSFSLKDQHEELREYLELVRRENAPGTEAWLTLIPYEKLAQLRPARQKESSFGRIWSSYLAH